MPSIASPISRGDASQVLVAAAGALTLLRRVEGEEAIIAMAKSVPSAHGSAAAGGSKPPNSLPHPTLNPSTSKHTPCRALVVCLRLARILTVHGADVRSYDACTGLFLGGASRHVEIRTARALPSLLPTLPYATPRVCSGDGRVQGRALDNHR